VEIEKRNITTPVVMTTGFSTVENAVKSLYTGAIGFIPKPFTIDELTSIIHRGIRYGEIISDVQSGVSQIGYVSCPAKYFRLGYSSWMNLENDGTVLIGATDLYYKTIDTITEIEFTEVEENITQGIFCIKFHTETELTHHLLSPVSGRVIEKNEKLITDTKLLEKDPYFNGWLYRIIPSDLDFEMKDLIPCSSDRI
jgi:glycine cleavage system H protein